MVQKRFPNKRKQGKNRVFSAEVTTPEINICGVDRLDTALSRYEPDLLVSICGHQVERKNADFAIDLYGPLTYRMDFDDLLSFAGGQAIKPDMIRDLFNFIDLNFPDSSPDSILAQCSMGISRSSAVGLLAGAHIAYRHAGFENGNPDAVLIARALVSRLRAAHSYMKPNRMVLDMGCHLIGEEMGVALMNEITGKHDIEMRI